MRAVQILGNERLTVRDFPDPEPTDGEVLVRIQASALCGSELPAYRGYQAIPMNGGHEVAGIVVDASRSHKWTENGRVGVTAVWGCGECRWCKEGRYTFCDARRGIPYGHAELVAVPDHCCLPLPEDVPFDVGALLSGDGLGVPYHISTRVPASKGQRVCIIGAGPIGLGNTLLRSFLEEQVIVIDVLDNRLSLARELGASHTINPSQTDPTEAVRDLTVGLMADVVIEATGKPDPFALAFRLVGKGGTVVAAGENREVTIHVGRDLIRKDVTVVGNWYYHFCEYPEMLALYRRGLPVARLITHRFPLAEAETAFREFAAGRTGKVVLLGERV
jgi:threonine dehydrogenase-like Zn-dependent dehydrogenase